MNHPAASRTAISNDFRPIPVAREGARNFDGLTLDGVDFAGADLRGANMSECTIRNCVFKNADLSDVCFAGSTIVDCDFSNVYFAGTMIEAATFSGCRFAGPSAFTLGWRADHLVRDNIWVGHDGFAVPFSSPPVVITGLPGVGTVVVMAGRAMVC